jgi:hypothetical protein
MSKIFINLYLVLLILFCLIIKSNSNEFSENRLSIPIIKLALNGHNIGEIEKIVISKFISGKEYILPKFNLTENIPFIGAINFCLNDSLLKILDIASSDIYFIEKDNLNININNFKGRMFFNYEFNSNFINSEGNGTLFINNIYFKVNNTFIQIKNKHEPEKEITGIKIDSINIDDIDFEFSFSKSGTFEKLIKYINNNLKTFLINVLKNEIANVDMIKKINEKSVELFENINLNLPINMIDVEDELKLSFSFNEKPIIKNNYVEFSLEGEIKGNQYEYDQINNISLPSIINSTELITNKSINTIISQFIFNNAIDVFYFYGKLNIEITNDTMGILEINVGMISGIISEITSKYKASQKAKLITKAISSPIVNLLTEDVIKFNLYENIQIFVYNVSENMNDDIGTIPVEAECSFEILANFDIKDKEIKLNVKSLKMISFEVKKSLIGEIITEKVIVNFNNNIIFLALQKINDKIKEVIENLKKTIINYQGINFSDILAKSYDNYIKIDISPILVSAFNLIYE